MDEYNPLNTGYDEKHTEQRGNTKVFGLQTANQLNRINRMTQIIQYMQHVL
jgi:hypothetical protein